MERVGMWLETGQKVAVRVVVVEELLGGNLYRIETKEGAQIVVPWQQVEMIEDIDAD